MIIIRHYDVRHLLFIIMMFVIYYSSLWYSSFSSHSHSDICYYHICHYDIRHTHIWFVTPIVWSRRLDAGVKVHCQLREWASFYRCYWFTATDGNVPLFNFPLALGTGITTSPLAVPYNTLHQEKNKSATFRNGKNAPFQQRISDRTCIVHRQFVGKVILLVTPIRFMCLPTFFIE